jgi:hypothetical protein
MCNKSVNLDVNTCTKGPVKGPGTPVCGDRAPESYHHQQLTLSMVELDPRQAEHWRSTNIG